jgi:hypothetical protein
VPEDEYATEASEIAEVLRIGGDLQGVLEAMRRIVDRNRRGVEIDAQRDRRAAEAIMEWYTSRKAELPEA